ncbi:NmrA family NAD(P)-binding protein [Amycolatopsis sp. NPDC059021]|uniref:NmrA family NAD(P)-binding protein n=1 Tax=Amycolatopsis sp. NPDC059021 TaxID=3346704 RepID=UPI00366C891F
MSRTLVIGGTGAMGSRVVRRLLQTPDAEVTVFTRDPSSPGAGKILDLDRDRVRLVAGDLNVPESVTAAMGDVDRVFCNTDFFGNGSVLAEHRQGIAVLEAARAASVEKFIWSSLDHAAVLTAGNTPVPHYDAKASVAAHIGTLRSEELMQRDADAWFTDHVSILTTSSYFENLQSRLTPEPGVLPDGRDGLVFTLPLGTGKYPLIGLDDIAWFAGFVFDHWQDWGSRDLAITADSLTGHEIAETFERVTGTPSGYQPLSLTTLESSMPVAGHDFAAMFRFFQERDVFQLDRDVALLRRIHPKMMTFEDWLRTTEWDGSRQDVQKFPLRPRR